MRSVISSSDGRAAARARALDRRLRLAVDGEHVGAVDDDALEPVGRPTRRQRRGGEVQVRRRGIGELVVVDHEDDRQPPHAGEVHRLVRRAVAPTSRRRASRAPRAARRARGTRVPRRPRPAGSRAGGTARRRCRSPGRHVLGAEVRIAPVRRAADASHVLAEHAPRLDAAVEVQAEVAVQRRGHVLRRHGRGDADGRPLVALAGVERARQLALLEEHVPALVEPAREQQRRAGSAGAPRGRARAPPHPPTRRPPPRCARSRSPSRQLRAFLSQGGCNTRGQVRTAGVRPARCGPDPHCAGQTRRRVN